MPTGRILLTTVTAGLGAVFTVFTLFFYALPLIPFPPFSDPDSGPVSDRNTFGNPAIEDLMEQCVLPATGAVIRLYRGNGGATTAFSYSVTYQSVSQPERQFFYAYSDPSVDQIECHDAEVTLISTDANPRTITASQITGTLIKQPIGYYRGEVSGLPSPIPGWAWPAALAILMFGISLVIFRTDRRTGL